MFDVITFGSASWDVFLRDKEFRLENSGKAFSRKKAFFPLGAKIDIDELHSFSGGGGTNTAATFSLLGFKTAYCGKVGMDFAGEAAMGDLERFGINLSLMSKTSEKPTNQSVIISIPGKDRTILAYRGAAETLLLEEMPWKKIISKWAYLAPLSGNLGKFFGLAVEELRKKRIKIAVNPGLFQLTAPKKKLWNDLGKTDVLILNREEASTLTGISPKKENEILLRITSLYPGIFVMTKGPKGVSVCSNDFIYNAGIFKSRVVDKTGAGDSFGSGFISGLIMKEDIEFAIQMGVANSTSCLSEWGAKNGLLKKGQKFRKIAVNKRQLKRLTI